MKNKISIKLLYLFRDELIKQLYDLEKQEKSINDIIKYVYTSLTNFIDRFED